MFVAGAFFRTLLGELSQLAVLPRITIITVIFGCDNLQKSKSIVRKNPENSVNFFSLVCGYAFG